MTNKKPISQKRMEREKEENRVLHRVFSVFLVGLVAEVYLLLVYRYYVNSSIDALLAWDKVLRWGTWIGLVMLAAGVAAGIVKREDRKLRTPMLWVAGVGGFLAVTGWVMTHIYPGGVTAMCVMAPVLMLLGMVFLLFQHECFLCTTMLAGSLFTVWLANASANSGLRTVVIAGIVLVALGLVAVAWLARKAQQGEGKLWGIRVCSPECDYRVVFAALAVCFICVLIALAAPAAYFYLMWVLGIGLFGELVYYTMKLM